jgi:hypothetical protein
MSREVMVQLLGVVIFVATVVVTIASIAHLF